MLKDQLYSDIVTAMKAGDKLKAEALKMIKSEIMKHEVSASDVQTTDEDVIKILQKAVKQRKEAEKGFLEGGKEDMALKEAKEAEIYESYLPEMMDEESIKKIVQEVIDQTGASGPADMGKVMGAVMGKVQGQADGNLVKEVVQKILNG